MITLFVSGCLLLGSILLVYLIVEIQRQKRPGYRSPSRRRIVQLDQRLQQELELLTGNSKTARRLVAGVKRSNPKRSLRWCQEKAIADLRRDRRV